MIGEMMQTRHALWQREAELAAGVPLVPHEEEEKHLAARLEAVLRGGTEAVDCQAAALYLLDDATSQLKMRSCWGLPLDRLDRPGQAAEGRGGRLGSPARPCGGHRGHRTCCGIGTSPRSSPPPSASPCRRPRLSWALSGSSPRSGEISRSRQTNLLEIIAGRLAAELEREILLREAVAGRGSEKTTPRRRTTAKQSIAHDLAAVGRLAIGRLDHASQRLGGRFPRLVLLAQRAAGRRRGARDESRGRGGVGRRRHESGPSRPRTVLSRGAANPQASQPDHLDRFRRRPARHAVFRPDSNLDRPDLLCLGGPAERAADSPATAGSRSAGFRRSWARVRNRITSNALGNCSPARFW